MRAPRVRFLPLAALALACAARAADGGVEAAPAAEASAGHAAPGSRPVVVLPVSFHFAVREEGHEILLNDVHVTIEDAATLGRVLSTVSDGPYLLASVPEGCYQVTATHAGRPQVTVIVVERGEPLRVAFYW